MTASKTHRPLLLGHRGARALKLIPENSLASFDQALADGCDGFEFDVRLTADGRAVICHDPQFREIEIAEASSGQLSGLARLDEVLEHYGERAFLDIELKVAGLEKTTLALLQKYPPKRGFVVSSFLPEVLRQIDALDATVPLGLICETKAELARWGELPIGYVIPHRKLVDSALLIQLRRAGKNTLVWTVNTAAEMRRLEEAGVDGIISDDTKMLCQTRFRYREAP